MDFEDLGDVLRAYSVWIVVAFLFLLGILAMTGVFGPLFNQIDNANFNSSPQHLQAVENYVSRDCVQIAQTKDPVEKKALENDIYNNTNTVNLNQLALPDDVRSCVMTARSHVMNGN